MASVCIQCQRCALSEEDSKNVITEECQVTKFLSLVSAQQCIMASIVTTSCPVGNLL